MLGFGENTVEIFIVWLWRRGTADEDREMLVITYVLFRESDAWVW